MPIVTISEEICREKPQLKSGTTAELKAIHILSTLKCFLFILILKVENVC